MKAWEKLLPIFFGIAACSWVPHWSCHYYKLETASSFVVGSLDFGVSASLFSMFIYSVFICLNLASISYTGFRFASALVSGIGHIALAIIHIVRLISPFTFEVFGYQWSTASSVREILIVLPFGILCIAVAVAVSGNAKQKTG